jgi:signal transduction histidine kinase
MDENILVEVSDNGIGISQENLPVYLSGFSGLTEVVQERLVVPA